MKTDEELIIEFQQDENIRSFEILVERYKNPLMNFVFRFTGQHDLSKDIVQETFIRVLKNRSNFKVEYKFSTWIYTIAGNLAKSQLARQKQQNNVSLSSYQEGEPDMDIVDKGLSPDAIVDMEIKETLIQQALLKVPELYREAVILRDIQELSYDEIAEMLQTSTGTVKSRINRGRGMLQELLQEIYKDT